jgi:hypothetical protein
MFSCFRVDPLKHCIYEIVSMFSLGEAQTGDTYGSLEISIGGHFMGV